MQIVVRNITLVICGVVQQVEAKNTTLVTYGIVHKQKQHITNIDIELGQIIAIIFIHLVHILKPQTVSLEQNMHIDILRGQITVAGLILLQRRQIQNY